MPKNMSLKKFIKNLFFTRSFFNRRIHEGVQSITDIYSSIAEKQTNYCLKELGMSRIPNIDDLAGQVVSKCVIGDEKPTKVSQAIDVSVVTVCFNPLEAGRKELFLKNLDSVQAQEGILLEHLIIDGHSTDGTIEWLMEYQNEKYDIRILSKSDSGIYEAMNRGIALAKGKYIIFLNSDDYFHDNYGMNVSFSRIEKFQCEFSFAPICFSDSSIRHHPQLAPQKRLHHFLISWPASHQSMLTKRSSLISLDGFDTTYRSAADYDLLLRMIISGAKGCYVPLAFSTFTLGGFSCSPENSTLIREECARSLQDFYRKFYSVNMSQIEVEKIFSNRVYPRKYKDIYVKSQRLIRERFIGIPQGPINWASQCFNFIKYYLKCIKSRE